ncbi:hypothetical protein RND81_02G109100 [Saponaria officinalis]|uniref:Uncharacterized protein n=1 Tax=Saponaria officinalis TaxID=3572 RepID=A0AAW1MSJ9_SAPOF
MSIMVKPAQETPQKILHLSKLDMIIRAPKTHTDEFFIYDKPPPSKLSLYFNAEILKNTLSKILVPYYPLAGRLQLNQNRDRYEINCNAMGALFIETETNLTLKYLNETNLTLKYLNGFEPSAALRELLIPECDYTRDLCLIPLSMVQVTWFKCGGFGLGFALHHHVADGPAHAEFVVKFLTLVAGFDIPISPVHDRFHVAPRDPLCIKYQHVHEFDPIVSSLPSNGFTTGDQIYDTAQSLLKISKQQIQVLKHATLSQAMKYTNNNNHKISTFAIIASHIWRSACNARDIPHDQEVKLYIPVDGRSRLKDPVMPETYFGNVIFFAICIAKAGDVIHRPIWYTASKIQDSTEKMDDESTHKIMYSDLKINLWVKFPFYKADFGWGPPKVVRTCEIKVEGLSFLIDGPDGDDGLTLAINLFSVHIPMFKNHLYSFMPTNSSL